MQFHLRTSLAVLTFTLLAAASAAHALPGVVVDNDPVVTLAQSESQEVEGEEGKYGQTPATGGEEAGGGAAMAPAPQSSDPNFPVNTLEEKGLQEEGREPQ
jgi:hypothetical protein